MKKWKEITFTREETFECFYHMEVPADFEEGDDPFSVDNTIISYKLDEDSYGGDITNMEIGDIQG
jgi:hypothetical protein